MSSSALEQHTTEPDSEPTRFEAISITTEGKTKHLIPKEHFCLIPLTLKQFKKLAKWHQKHHDMHAHVDIATGDLMLINETLHGKWFERKQKQKKGPA